MLENIWPLPIKSFYKRLLTFKVITNYVIIINNNKVIDIWRTLNYVDKFSFEH